MGVTRTFQIMRPYYSLPAYKNLVIPLFSPRARRTGGWRGGGRLGDRNTVGIDILEEIGFESATPTSRTKWRQPCRRDI
jgi:branched-chain amino acid transport system ATP-binding protein